MVVAPFHSFNPQNAPTFDRTLVRGEVGLNYVLFDAGERGALSRGAEAAARASLSLKSEIEMQLLESVGAAYMSVLGSRRFADAAAAHRVALESALDLSRRRFGEGTVPEVEVMRAEAVLLDAEAAEASARARVVQAERSLARLMGVAPETIQNQPLADVVAGADVSPASSEAGATRPSVLAAREAAEAARARAAVERSRRFPTVAFSVGLQNFGATGEAFVTEWQTGVHLSWSLFTGGARAAAIRRADASADAAEAEVGLRGLEAEGEVDASEAALSDALGRSAALQASVVRWEEVSRVEALRLEEGAGVQQDFLDAEAGLFNARAQLADAQYDAVLARIVRARALGVLTRSWLDAELEATP
jgi:multidrug efflux system outer membrane protein